MTNTTIATYAQEILLSEYAKEIIPKYRQLADLKQTLKEWVESDELISEYKSQIKEMQDNIKAHIEDKESALVRDIKDLVTDIGLGCKAAGAKSEYEVKDLKAYFKKRAEDKVEEVVQKGVIFSALDSELS